MNTVNSYKKSAVEQSARGYEEYRQMTPASATPATPGGSKPMKKQAKKKREDPHFEHLIMSNRQQAKQVPKQRPSTFIPIQNIFATSEAESRKLLKQ